MLSVGDIMKEAFDGVAAELSGVIKTATVTRHTPTGYDPATGQNTFSPPVTQTGRAVIENESTIKNVFPGYVAVGTERLVLLEGLSWAPQEGDQVAVESLWSGRKCTAVLDLLGAGGAYRVVVL
jgi:hypothetical protein